VKNLLFSAFFFVSALSLSQTEKSSFINYSVKDGLCENAVNSVTQDSRGFIWIGTQSGFNRFDGLGFKKFFPTDLIGNWEMTDKTLFYFEVKPNVILTKLGDQKLYTFNTISQELKSVAILKNLKCGEINKLNANQFVVSLNNCAWVMDANFHLLEKIVPPLLKKDVFVSVRKLSANSYFVFSGNEFFEYSITDKKYRRIVPKIKLEEAHQSGYSVLYVDPRSKTFFINNFFRGFFRVDLQGNQLCHWQNGVTREVVTSNPNKMIAASKEQGLFWLSGDVGISLLNINTNKSQNFTPETNNPFSLPSDYSCNLFVDNQKRLWVSSSNGVSRQNKFPIWIDTWNLQTDKNYPFMNLLHTSTGDMFASVYFGGVFRLKEKSEYEQIKPSELDGTWFLFEDNKTIVQGGAGKTIKQYNLRTKEVTQQNYLAPYFPNSNLIVMGHKAKNGDIWYSGNAGGGLVRLEQKTGKKHHFSSKINSFSGSYFTCCTESKNGDLWFGSNKSLALLHWIHEKQQFEEINFAPKFEKAGYYLSGINCMTIQESKIIWLGFDGTGLVKYNLETNEMTLHTNRQGLLDNFIFSLLLDGKNRLWIGTGKGLGCLSADEGHIYNFNLQNGFPSESFETNCAQFDEKTNHLWFASTDLLLRFNPDQILLSKRRKIDIFIDEFIVNNKNRYKESTINFHLKPEENNLQISFCTLNFSGNNDVIYSYQLQGGENKWRLAGNNKSTSLINLRDGEYTFRLRAKLLGDKHWTYLKTPMSFTIETPWYKSWWFLLLIFIVSVLFLYVLIRSYFVREIEQQKASLERQKAVQNERDRIAYDMHDDLGSGLTKISYLSQMAMDKPDKIEELSKINKTSVELVENMSELIWAMKVENDSLQDLITYLKLYAVEYLEFNSIELRVDMPENFEEKPISGEARRHLFLLFKESLHNIVKHAGAKKATIIFELQTEFCMIIHDNGVGFNRDEKERSRGNGLRNIEKRVQKLNGTWEIVSLGGTQLIFRFPFEKLI